MGGLPAKKKKAKPIPKAPHKLKPINVSKIPKRLLGKTVWNDVDETVLFDKLDLDAFTETFKKAEVKAAPAALTKAKSNKPKTVSLLDGKRSNNVAILLGRFKLSFAEVRQAIMELDEDALTEQQTKSILNVVPTEEEVATLKGYSGDVAQLGRAERFFMQLIKVPRLEPRMKAFVYKRGFEEAVADVEPDLNNLLAACEELDASERFVEILTIVLAYANYANADNFRKNMPGIKWKDLTSLSDTRGANGVTFLHVLVETVDTKFPELAGIEDELAHAASAARVSLDASGAEIGTLQRSLDALGRELSDFVDEYKTPGDMFPEKMQIFYEHALLALGRLHSTEEKIESKFAAVKAKFGVDKKVSNEEFFSVLAEFLVSFGKAREENVKRKLKAEKMAAREAAAASSGAAAASSSSGGAGASSSSSAASGAGGRNGRAGSAGPGAAVAMDDLISSLKSGEALLKKRDRRDRSRRMSSNAAVASEAKEMFAKLKKKRAKA